MTIVLFIFSILILLFGAWLISKECDMLGGTCCTFGGFGLFVSIILLVWFAVCLSGAQTVDEKIAMYTEENEKIELQIAEAVEGYQEYESGVFEKVKPESAITLVTVYPELKADTLVQKQIEVYLSNNEKIKELKTTKIEEKIYRWWLYFGVGSDE